MKSALETSFSKILKMYLDTNYSTTSESDLDTVKPFPLATSTVTWNTEKTTLTPPNPTDLKELAWIIPSVIAGVVVMLIIAILCFYGVRTTELFVMKWCYKNYGCCNPAEKEEYNKLKDGFDPESYSLNDMSHHRTSLKR